MFEVFMESMNARIKAMGMVGVIFVLLTCFLYEIVILSVSNKTPVLE